MQFLVVVHIFQTTSQKFFSAGLKSSEISLFFPRSRYFAYHGSLISDTRT